MEFWKNRLPPRISPSATQPSADELIDYKDYKEILKELSKSPRVRVFSGGKSYKQREIYYLVISDPENIKKLFYFKELAKKFSGPQIEYLTLKDFKVKQPSFSKLKEVKVTVLMHAASWPFEAAHTEALIEVAKILAYSEDALIMDILEKEIVVIVPMMCPDGRELAIEEWRKFPLSDGRSGAGNFRGTNLNRDFNRLAEPETTAVHKIYNEWEPFVAYDPHEDLMALGVNPDWPELCWCPPYGEPRYKGLNPKIREVIKELGNAIAEEWKEKGFNFRYHPEGEGALLDELGLGSQCFDLHFALHGTPVIVTESARTPGTNSWKERIEQKFTAAMAILKKVAENPSHFVETKYAIRRENLTGENSAYVIPVKTPEQKDPLAVYLLIENLLKCQIQVYYTTTPYESYVIPINQPEKMVIIDKLKVQRWYPWTLSLAFGVTIRLMDSLKTHEREQFANAELKPIHYPILPVGRII